MRVIQVRIELMRIVRIFVLIFFFARDRTKSIVVDESRRSGQQQCDITCRRVYGYNLYDERNALSVERYFTRTVYEFDMVLNASRD